jgi:hypothetical protein
MDELHRHRRSEGPEAEEGTVVERYTQKRRDLILRTILHHLPPLATAVIQAISKPTTNQPIKMWITS